MYTQLPHDRIFTNVRRAVVEAIDYLHSPSSSITKLSRLKDADYIMEHLQFVVSNTYFSNTTDIVRQQTIGIPMGTNAAPEIANLTLYADEAQFIDHLIATADTSTALKLAHTHRYIDDLLVWDTPPPPEDIYGLQYSEQTEPTGSVTFLGARITPLCNGRIDMSVFDKTEAWDFNVLRYTHADSNAPPHQTVGIFLSQLVRFRGICNSIRNFMRATTNLTQRMLERGHQPYLLLKGFRRYMMRFSRDKTTVIPRLSRWFRKMLTWASYHQSPIPQPPSRPPLLLPPSSRPTASTPSARPSSQLQSATSSSATPSDHSTSSTDEHSITTTPSHRTSRLDISSPSHSSSPLSNILDDHSPLAPSPSSSSSSTSSPSTSSSSDSHLSDITSSSPSPSFPHLRTVRVSIYGRPILDAPHRRNRRRRRPTPSPFRPCLSPLSPSPSQSSLLSSVVQPSPPAATQSSSLPFDDIQDCPPPTDFRLSSSNDLVSVVLTIPYTCSDLLSELSMCDDTNTWLRTQATPFLRVEIKSSDTLSGSTRGDGCCGLRHLYQAEFRDPVYIEDRDTVSDVNFTNKSSPPYKLFRSWLQELFSRVDYHISHISQVHRDYHPYLEECRPFLQYQSRWIHQVSTTTAFLPSGTIPGTTIETWYFQFYSGLLAPSERPLSSFSLLHDNYRKFITNYQLSHDSAYLLQPPFLFNYSQMVDIFTRQDFLGFSNNHFYLLPSVDYLPAFNSCIEDLASRILTHFLEAVHTPSSSPLPSFSDHSVSASSVSPSSRPDTSLPVLSCPSDTVSPHLYLSTQHLVSQAYHLSLDSSVQLHPLVITYLRHTYRLYQIQGAAEVNLQLPLCRFCLRACKRPKGHRRQKNAPYGCHNIARLRAYLCHHLPSLGQCGVPYAEVGITSLDDLPSQFPQLGPSQTGDLSPTTSTPDNSNTALGSSPTLAISQPSSLDDAGY
eukprot:CAMPEP_0182437162 /NCGR_PEP_ID=MMETSP1167-20130531/84855_1 /TAXON_ID=2988 /ORGANISM="Mallomonas Sp, Strain CCMP3275" /LENGTH=950 /DNA_ID=CAMNT_0024629975 /DNA_START=63 /DNA_END=2915 /DNA_ORIENTATION=-